VYPQYSEKKKDYKGNQPTVYKEKRKNPSFWKKGSFTKNYIKGFEVSLAGVLEGGAL